VLNAAYLQLSFKHWLNAMVINKSNSISASEKWNTKTSDEHKHCMMQFDTAFEGTEGPDF